MNLPVRIEVFKTDIPDEKQFRNLLYMLNSSVQKDEITFDPEDCDRVLRIVCSNQFLGLFPQLIRSRGYICEILA